MMGTDYVSRADALSDLLDGAFAALMDISEWPNRAKYPEENPEALALAEKARRACSVIELGDPDRDS
jgi:hypothetical protein